MHADRYVKAILTIIAIELGWLAFSHTATPVSAQATATPVVITGIELKQPAFLPVGVLGQTRVPPGLAASFQPLDTTIRNERVAVSVGMPVDVRAITPVKIDTSDTPLRVENVGYTPAQRPGE